MSKSPAIHKPKLRPCVIRMGETCENNCGGWAKTNQIPVSSKLWLKLRRLRVRVLTCADDGSHLRVVAQLGSALDWGSRGRWFESSPPDHERAGQRLRSLAFFLYVPFDVLFTDCKPCSSFHLKFFRPFSRSEKLFGERLRHASSCKIVASGMRRFAYPRELFGWLWLMPTSPPSVSRSARMLAHRQSSVSTLPVGLQVVFP